MLHAIVAGALVGYVPGALLFRLPVGRRVRRAALAAEERAFWAVMLSLAWSLAVVMTLAVAGRYAFTRLLVVNGGASALILVSLRRHLRLPRAPRIGLGALLPIGLVAAGAWLFFPTSEYIIGGKDPGTYINEGIQIAQRGSLVVRDPVVADVPPAYRDLFFPAYGQEPLYYSLRFMGFYVQDPDTGAVIGQFPQLFPASIAIGYGLDGLSGARDAVAVWAVLGLLAVYFAGAALFGRAAAAAGAALLAIHVVEVWFARYPNSEVMMQALLFTALLAFARAAEDGDAFFGAAAGVFLGGMLFLRYEVLLAVFVCCLVAVLAPAARQRMSAAFALALAAAGGAGLWYLEGPMRAYSELPLRFTRDVGGWWIAAGALAAAWIVRRLLRREGVLTAIRRTVPAALAAGLAGLAIYAYFFRHVGPGLGPHDAVSFRTFGWYVAPPILAVAVAAAAVMAAIAFWQQPAFLLTFAAFSVFFFYKTRIIPEQFWAARRFLVVPLPGLLLLLAAFADRVVGPSALVRLARRRHWQAPAAAAVATAAGAVLLGAALMPVARSFWAATTPILHHVEYAGIIPRLERLAGGIRDDDLLVVESRNAGSDLHVLAEPLAYIYARHVLVLSSPVPPKRALDGFVAWARTKYARVLFMGGGGTDLLTKHLSAEPIGGDRFQVPEYDAPQNAYPSGVHQKEFEYGLYRLVPADRVLGGPVDVQIGQLDDLNVIRFHAKETGTHGIFRWTQAQSFVLLLGIPADARTLTIWMGNGGRPPQAPPATVEVALDDVVIGTATPDDEIRPYAFGIPPDLAARVSAAEDPIRLRLRVPTWKPSQLLSVSDTRDLGVMVTRVRVE